MRNRLSSTSILLTVVFIAWHASLVADAIETEPLFMGSLEFESSNVQCREYIGDKLTLYVLHSEREGSNGEPESLRYLSLGSVSKLQFLITFYFLSGSTTTWFTPRLMYLFCF